MKKKRRIFVIIFLVVFALYSYVSMRGSYLQMISIGSKYAEVFKKEIMQELKVFVVSGILIYLITYITTIFIKKGLKKFFAEEKKEMPKLPTKSVSLAFAGIIGLIVSDTMTEKIMLAISGTLFGKTDPIFNLDIGYYVFQKTAIEMLLYYLIAYFIVLSLYIVTYYILVFHSYFKKGISMDTLKHNTFIKHLLVNLFIIVICFSILTVVNIQDVVNGKFMTIKDSTSLYGAGLIDVTIKKYGYMIFSVFIILAVIKALSYMKKSRPRRAAVCLIAIPAYLMVLFTVILIFDLTYVKQNEYDKEKEYIKSNIEFTKLAYNINITEVEIENSGTITKEDISNNPDVINNINIMNNEMILTNLREYNASFGYYNFVSTKTGLYNINEERKLVYLTPREIVNNDTRTYNNKTYKYTHGYGVIVNSASETEDTGNLKYIQTGLEENQILTTSEPRIYFGIETNSPVVINPGTDEEFDYPINSTTNNYNTYTGQAGVSLGVIDRIILSIKEKELKLAFSANKNSTIITNRNIINRAKAIMPYLIYDDEPYLIATDDGELKWILDAYTTTNAYPYSQVTQLIDENNINIEKINYIRNSVKVIIDAYDGTMQYYITDRTDPLIMAYWNMYPSIFEDLNAQIPEEISNHLLYPKYLYKIQSNMLEMYHNVEPEVLYRADDIWDSAKENTSRITTVSGTDISPYYTMTKTADSEDANLGLIIPYTITGKQNINSYLVGTYSNGNKLTLYKLKGETAILGTIQLDTLIEQDETISQELSTLEVPGTELEKHIIVIPINNTLLYVEPIYQIRLNEKSKVPILKKVIVASGNKVAIGNDVKTAIKNLLSQEAVSIKVEEVNVEELIQEIIKANNNLEESNLRNDWEMIGKDMATLQALITQLETLLEEQEKDETGLLNPILDAVTSE